MSSSTTILQAKPFLKWAGGKSQLLPVITPKLIHQLSGKKDVTYIEPFVGGGAVLFFILNNFKNLTNIIINDINPHLINAYKAIRYYHTGLMGILSEYQADYDCLTEDERRQFYLNCRTRFNNTNNSSLEDAALLIFLNRTCFNGLYRENSKGGFNVPFGKYAKPKIFDESNLLQCHEALQRVNILQGDYAQVAKHITRNTFVYFDPPYRPINPTSSFTSYAKAGFDDNEQIRLSEFFKQLHSLGCSLLLSNSDGKSYDPANVFIDELYHGFIIDRVRASRSINSNPTKRGNLTELLIRNFDMP